MGGKTTLVAAVVAVVALGLGAAVYGVSGEQIAALVAPTLTALLTLLRAEQANAKLDRITNGELEEKVEGVVVRVLARFGIHGPGQEG